MRTIPSSSRWRKRFFGNVRNVAGNDFRSKLGFTDFNHEVDDMNAGKGVVLDQFAADDDGVLEVIAGPWHKGHNQVFTERQLAVLDRHTFNQHIASFDFVAGADNDFLVDRRAFVAADEVLRLVGLAAFLIFDDHFLRGGLGDFAGSLRPEQPGQYCGQQSVSRPVPTIGAAGWISGTAWRCWLEPISERYT